MNGKHCQWLFFFSLFSASALPEVQASNIQIITLNEPHVIGFNQGDADSPGPFIVGIAKTRPPDGVRGRSLAITEANGTKYTCYLPPKKDFSSVTADPMVATLLQGKSPEELMDDLGEFCSYRVEEWWTYELCYKKAARQYHTENGKVTDSYILGNFSAADSNMIAPAVDTEAGGDVKYVKQVYVGGAPCELTGGNRSAEVRFVCGRAGQTVLSEIREPESCAYIFIVSTPRLCKHPAFRDRIPAAAPIACYPAEVQEDSCSNTGEGEEVCSTSGKEAAMEELKPIPLLIDGVLVKSVAKMEQMHAHSASDASNNSSSSSIFEEDGAVDGVKLEDVFGDDEIIP
ncbi:putative Protein OS-9-like protein [Nannochloris sp. 'desiccata']|nr:hypothetical protein KSW81_006853 [Chlorella desiccata (nom. nud.)]KAH7622065.1 putative Protein OS-9-like protein [Chlorella desiccata (nom. nud.)]